MKFLAKYATVIAALLVVGLIAAACSKGNAPSASPSNSPSAGSVSESPAATQTESGAPTAEPEQKPVKFDPPVTITTVRSVSANATFRDGENIDDNVHTRWMKDNLGIVIKNLWTTPEAQNNAYQTKLRLALSSNEPLPDVFMIDDKSLAQDFIDAGKVLEVGDLFEQKANALWKQSMSEASDSWAAFGKDGKKYGLPEVDTSALNPVLWIRQDWLTKLNLDPPQTLDDVEKIAEAFVGGDPDGDGANNTIGLGLALKNTYKENIGDATFAFGAYGTIPDQWNRLADGTAGYGSVQPEAKQALAKLADWKKKGLLAADVGLTDWAKLTEGITSGKVGMFSGLNWMPWYPFPDLLKNDPDADFQPFALPVGPDGKAGAFDFQSAAKALFINKNAKPEVVDAIFAYMNQLFEMTYPEEGSEFEFGFHEGYDWAMVDGEPTRDAAKIPGGSIDTKKYFLIWEMPNVPSLDNAGPIKRANNEPLVTPQEKLYKDHPALQMKVYKIALDQNVGFIDIFSGAPTPTMKSKWAILEKLKLENYSKFIYGERPLEQFDEFVKEWNAAGGQQVTEEVDSWYQASAQK